MDGSVSPGRDMVADVIVVGGGASGLAAALEAARGGSSTIVLEQADRTGGMMNWAVGTISAVNTPHQRRAGIYDHVDDHFEDLGVHAGALASRDNLELRRVLVDRTPDLMRWLTDLGLVFVGPVLDPPQRCARLHNVVPSAASFAYHLTRACVSSGVIIHLNTTVEHLLGEEGEVDGVEAIGPSGRQRFRARQGVILASGDYSGSADLKRLFGAPELADLEAVAKTSTGAGYRMALALGASVRNGDIIRGPIMRFVPPRSPSLINRLPPIHAVAKAIEWSMRTIPPVLLRPFLMKFLTTVLGPSPSLFQNGAILVNRKGERFADERRSPAGDVAHQPGREAFIVFDSRLAEMYGAWPHFVSTAPGIAYAYLEDYRRCRKDIFFEAGDLPALAARLGMPSAILSATVGEANAQASGAGVGLRRPPFFALGPVRSYVVFTEGGLAITPSFEVLREDHPIPGLFAVGSVGQGGVLLEGHGHHLDWAFISGQLAGRYVAGLPPRSDACRRSVPS